MANSRLTALPPEIRRIYLRDLVVESSPVQAIKWQEHKVLDPIATDNVTSLEASKLFWGQNTIIGGLSGSVYMLIPGIGPRPASNILGDTEQNVSCW